MKEYSLTLTILADNRCPQPVQPFKAEHGFSVLLEMIPVMEQKLPSSPRGILFDTGMGSLFSNAVASEVDLSCITDVVLSHGHYDHTDALASLLASYPTVRIHSSHSILQKHFSLRTGSCRPIGVSDENKALFEKLPSTQVHFFYGSSSIQDTPINLCENIIRHHPLEGPNSLLFADEGATISDTISDELVVWIETTQGLVILTGCCHAGFINTCEQVLSLSQNKHIYMVIGGFHLHGVSQERLNATVDFIKTHNIDHIIACHCTGEAETLLLQQKLPNKVVAGECGLQRNFSYSI